MYWFSVVPSFMGLELNALHPFGKDIVALLESCEGRCTDPGGCGEWCESADWLVNRTQSKGGRSSKDGLHHLQLKPTLISHVQALLSLALASMHKNDFDLSWLNTLPSADDTKLHDCMFAPTRFVNTRVSIAEVLEWQERNEEAIRCVCVLYPPTHPTHPHTHTHRIIISQDLLLHCWHIYICSPPSTLYPHPLCKTTASHRLKYKTASISMCPPRYAQGWCLVAAMRRWGSTRSRCQHLTPRSARPSAAAFCFRRHWQSDPGC
jgi:hypothetical protein